MFKSRAPSKTRHSHSHTCACRRPEIPRVLVPFPHHKLKHVQVMKCGQLNEAKYDSIVRHIIGHRHKSTVQSRYHESPSLHFLRVVFVLPPPP